VIELNPQTFWTYGLRGIAYANLKQYERAIEDFNRVLELSPQSTWARELRDEAIRLLKAPRQSEPFDPFAKDFLPQFPTPISTPPPIYPPSVPPPPPG
jgi:tetratricopeptide (TPR) repeat protein